jgi:hypothetical protein
VQRYSAKFAGKQSLNPTLDVALMAPRIQTTDVFIDSANAFSNATSPIAVFRALRLILGHLKGSNSAASPFSPGKLIMCRLDSSILTVLYHSGFPTAHSASSSTHLLLPLLVSIDLCPSLSQIRLHPSALVEHLANAYNIRVDQEDSENDIRVYDFLSRFHERLWGSGFRRPDEEEDQDEAATRLDALGDATVGKCVLEWMARGPAFRTSRTVSAPESIVPGRDSKASGLEQGLVGAVLNSNRGKSPRRVDVVPLSNVIDVEAVEKTWTSRADGEVSHTVFLFQIELTL